MGCNQSKNEDIKKSQEPRVRQTIPQPGAPVSTSPVGISADDKSGGDVSKLGKSYTDQREGEVDFLKKIIDSIEVNLIDTSASAALLEEKDALARAKDYSKRLKDSVISYKSIPVFTLPTPSNVNCNSKEDLLKNTSKFSSQEVDLIKTWSNSLANTFHTGMIIRDCGPIVVSF